jgi:hypothetical protein
MVAQPFLHFCEEALIDVADTAILLEPAELSNTEQQSVYFIPFSSVRLVLFWNPDGNKPGTPAEWRAK